MSPLNRNKAAIAFGLLLAVVLSHPAYALSSQLDDITDVYKNGAAAWEPVLRGYANSLFWILAGIEFAVASLKLAIKGADFGEWSAELLNRIMFVGFFAALLANSDTWARAIIDSFRQAGDAASQSSGGSGGVRPSDVFNAGVQLAGSLMKDVGVNILADFMPTILSIFGALVIIVCFALISALMILTLVESYLIISAGVLLMGFGGSRWTKDFAVKTLIYSVSVGAKLFVMQLVVGLGETIVKGWAAQFANTGSTEGIFTIVGASVVMLALTKTLPDIVQGLISGVSPSGSGIMAVAAGSVAGAATGAIAGVAGAIGAVGAAGALATQQMGGGAVGSLAAAAGAAGTGGIGGAGAGIANLASGSTGSILNDVGSRLSGGSSWTGPGGASPSSDGGSGSVASTDGGSPRQGPDTSASSQGVGEASASKTSPGAVSPSSSGGEGGYSTTDQAPSGGLFSQGKGFAKALGDGAARVGELVGRTATNLTTAAASDIAGGVTGAHRGAGTMGGRMASDMMGKAAELKAKSAAPAMPSGVFESQASPAGPVGSVGAGQPSAGGGGTASNLTDPVSSGVGPSVAPSTDVSSPAQPDVSRQQPGGIDAASLDSSAGSRGNDTEIDPDAASPSDLDPDAG